MRKVLMCGAVILALGGGGCFTTPEQREEAAEKVALKAKFEAEKLAYDEQIKLGLPPEQAELIAKRAGEHAYKLAKEGASKVGTLGQIGALALWLLTNIGLPLLQKKVGVA